MLTKSGERCKNAIWFTGMNNKSGGLKTGHLWIRVTNCNHLVWSKCVHFIPVLRCYYGTCGRVCNETCPYQPLSFVETKNLKVYRLLVDVRGLRVRYQAWLCLNIYLQNWWLLIHKNHKLNYFILKTKSLICIKYTKLDRCYEKIQHSLLLTHFLLSCNTLNSYFQTDSPVHLNKTSH